MFTCTCCSPSHSYTKQKNLYRHQRKYDPNYTDPLTRIAKERRDAYYADPNKCLMCGEMLAYDDVVSGRKDKFCSRSCAAIQNNLNGTIGWNASKIREARSRRCLNCSTPVSNKLKYCSMACDQTYRWTSFKADPNSVWSSKRRKRQLLETYGYECQKCHNKEWNGIPITIELEHIDGNSENNSEENTMLLCPNCHSQTPTYKAKNKGNGRAWRRQRYADGKSY